MSFRSRLSSKVLHTFGATVETRPQPAPRAGAAAPARMDADALRASIDALCARTVVERVDHRDVPRFG